MWTLWELSQAYHTKPSSILGVTEGLPAFAIDRAVWTFAREISNAQEVAVGRLPKNAKDATVSYVRDRVLHTFLGLDNADTPGRFKEPTMRRG